MRKTKMFGMSYDGHKEEESDDEKDTQIKENGSQYSLTGFLIPSLGAIAPYGSRRPELRRFIISPYNHHYRLWNKFIIILVFYTAWACPFEFGFLDQSKGALAITDNIVNGFFAIDIVLTFFVAYLDKDSYLFVDVPNRIALRYAKSWLVFDIIATIPYEVVHNILPPNLQIYAYFNILRLWRLCRVSSMFARLEKDRNYDYFWVRCSKLICVTLFLVHVAACSLYFLARRRGHPQTAWLSLLSDVSNQSLWDGYVTAMYLAISTLSSVGYGDLHPVKTDEMIFSILYMLFDFGLIAYLIGNMSSMVVHWTQRTQRYRDTVQYASNFVQRNKLPARLQEQIFAHLLMKYRTNLEGLQQQEIIDSLPKAIQSSITHYLFYSLAQKVYLFDGVSNDLLFQLVTEMKAEYFPPKEDVILQNETPTDFYILVAGAADLIVLTNEGERVIGQVKAGDVVGEIGVLCYKPQLFTVRTKRLSQILRLSRTTFLNFANSNIGDGTIIMNNFLEHLHKSKDPMMKGILGELETMMARGKVDLPISLLFVANKGDDILLQQLLSKGSDPNEIDHKNGKTALHIAASKGSDHCVVLLLENGADPNIQDFEGSVPLLEAINGRHESVIKLLMDNGADVGHLACLAVEKNDIKLLKDIIKYGGDVTLSSNNHGCSTALHAAVCEGNIEIVKLLVDQRADIDRENELGWTPRGYADHQCHKEIQNLFQNIGQNKTRPRGIPDQISFPERYQSEPVLPQGNQDQLTWLDNQQRRRPGPFGMMSAANHDNKKGFPAPQSSHTTPPNVNDLSVRVKLSSPEKSEDAEKLVFLPKSIQELLRIGAKKFDFSPTKILTQEGAEVEDIYLIRDGDHLILA